MLIQKNLIIYILAEVFRESGCINPEVLVAFHINGETIARGG